MSGISSRLQVFTSTQSNSPYLFPPPTHVVVYVLVRPLRQLAYRMLSGPWRQLYIKYGTVASVVVKAAPSRHTHATLTHSTARAGYDPRKHKDAYVYQVIEWSKGTKVRAHGLLMRLLPPPIPADLHTCAPTPTPSVFFCCCFCFVFVFLWWWWWWWSL